MYFLIDRSGSMQSIREDVICGFDAFFREQRHQPGRSFVTIAQFDCHEPYDVLVRGLPLRRVRSLRHRFHPRGGTPLFDAIGALLDDAERDPYDSDKLVVILTDGFENSSRLWTRQTLFDRITGLRSHGWTFVFLGANQDSYAVGRGLGLAEGSVSNFVGDGRGARLACESLSRATGEWRSKHQNERRRDEANFFGGRKEAETNVRPVGLAPRTGLPRRPRNASADVRAASAARLAAKGSDNSPR